MNNINVFKNIESILIIKNEVPIIPKEILRDIILYITLGVSMYLLGALL